MPVKMSEEEMAMAAKIATENALIELGEQRQEEKMKDKEKHNILLQKEQELLSITSTPDIATKRQLCSKINEYITLINQREDNNNIVISKLRSECKELIDEINDVNKDADVNEQKLESRIISLREKCKTRNETIKKQKYMLYFTNFFNTVITVLFMYFGLYSCMKGVVDGITIAVNNIFAMITIFINVIWYIGCVIYYLPMYIISACQIMNFLFWQAVNYISNNTYIKACIVVFAIANAPY